jgi:hypothetical protein
MISGSPTRGATPACNVSGIFTVLFGGRKDAEVAGRVSTRGVEVDAVRDAAEATRPVTVAGRVGGVICDGFLVGPALGVGTTCTACPRFEGT